MIKNNMVFISYSHSDSQFASKLSHDLNKNGVKTWFAPQQIRPGDSWKDSILNAITEIEFFIIILSKSSIIPNWVNKEINSFARKDKNIIPIIIDDVNLSLIPSVFKELQYINFSKNYTNGLSSLLTILPGFIIQEKPVIVEKQKSKGYVFISYTEFNVDFVNKLKKLLKKNKIAFWDYKDGIRNYQMHFFLELESVIKDAIATLSIISPSWKKSKWCLKELMFSEEIETPVFLLRVDLLEPTLVIAGIPYIDFVENADLGFEKLLREIKKKL